MPRPPESPLRRFMMQAIMWVILLGSVGAAALVDARLRQFGPEHTFGPITFRLPRGWEETENHSARMFQYSTGDEPFTQTFTVRRESAALALEAFRDPPVVLKATTLTLADGTAVSVSALRRSSRYSGQSDLEVLAALNSGDGGRLFVSLRQLSLARNARERDAAIAMMQRILQTVRFRDPARIS